MVPRNPPKLMPHKTSAGTSKTTRRHIPITNKLQKLAIG
jgi:hypothetical protein